MHHHGACTALAEGAGAVNTTTGTRAAEEHRDTTAWITTYLPGTPKVPNLNCVVVLTRTWPHC